MRRALCSKKLLLSQTVWTRKSPELSKYLEIISDDEVRQVCLGEGEAAVTT